MVNIHNLTIGAYSQGISGGLLEGGWWFLTFYCFVAYVIVGSADKPGESPENIRAYFRDTGYAVLAAVLTTTFARWLFDLPKLIELDISHNVEYSHADEATQHMAYENYCARQQCQPEPHPNVCIPYFKQPIVYWPGVFFTVGAIGVVQAAYLFRGKFDGIYNDPTIIAAVVTAIAGLMVLASVVDMWLRPAPWSWTTSNQQTLKYILAVCPLFAVPAFYDIIVPGDVYVRMGATIGVNIGLWILFYFWATYVWSDHVLYGKPNHAFWFAVIGIIPSVFGWLAGAIANDEYPGDSFAALISQVTASAVTMAVYYIIYALWYQGYHPETCKTD